MNYDTLHNERQTIANLIKIMPSIEHQLDFLLEDNLNNIIEMCVPV